MATQVRSDATNLGKQWGEALGNTKTGKALDKAAKEVGQVFVDYGKAINKAANETVYGNAKTPDAVAGGAFANALAERSLSSAARGGALGLLGEFGYRSVKNVATDVFGYGK